MRPWYYMNGGDWTWFGARMVGQLARHGFAAEALRELEPMMDRVLEHGAFREWWTRDNQPMGAKNFKGSAGELIEAIQELRKWANERA
jgi:GH15 family glucan-1,4-alpha-glucosidase